MSVIRKSAGRAPARAARPDDPRVLRTRAAVLDAARALFLERGYDGTSMDDIAARAGLSKRTLYNNYGGKAELFLEIADGIVRYAESFVQELRADLRGPLTRRRLRPAFRALAGRLAVAIVRPEVVALRRLLISEWRHFPELGADYYRRAPGQVIGALATGFRRLVAARLLHAPSATVAATQFAYLVAGPALDHAILTGTVPSRERLTRWAEEGCETFLARYAGPR